jgi:hypothetical protein
MDRIAYGAIAAQTTTRRRDIQRILEAAAHFDDSLALQTNMVAKLAKKRVPPRRFSRSALFERMLVCEPSLFYGLPIRPHINRRKSGEFLLLDELRAGLPRSTRARVRTERSVRSLPLSRVLNMWARADSVFGVTDLHFIGTRFDALMDTTGLNDFSLLPRGTDGFQSQDSLVISSAGAITDSHSDDHAGSNHCFIGAKLWLLWDTLEGFKHGLEDWEHCVVYDRAAFDLPAFLAMRSSRWILIGPGQTMFIPANLTHKVITLQRYLGLGSFHAGLPGFVDLLMRWARLQPIWAPRSLRNTRCSVGFLTRRAIRRVESLRKASRCERFHWGVPHLQARLRRPDVSDDIIDRNFGSRNASNLKAFIRAARRLSTVVV